MTGEHSRLQTPSKRYKDRAFQHISLRHYLIELSALDKLSLPAYKGSTLRGAFGHSFKRAVCSMRGKSCDECLLKSACPFAYCFLTPPVAGAQMMRKYPRAPHSFVVEPPEDGKNIYAAGELLSFGLVLVGKGSVTFPISFMPSGSWRSRASAKPERGASLRGPTRSMLRHGNI